MTAAPSLAPAQVRPELTARPVARLQRCGGTTCPPGTCGHDDEPKVARFATGAGPTRAPAIVGSVLAAAGRPLSGPVRTTMEARFGHDFSRVRVHTDATAASSARAVHALAYTVGSDIAFDAGRYAPDTAAGQRLLAHELAHVVQQRSTAPADLAGLTVSQASDPAEAEAARTAGRATPDEAAPPSVHSSLHPVGAPGIQRQAQSPPAPETEDCEVWQTTMLTAHLQAARTWVNDADRKIRDYAFVFASTRHSAVPRSSTESAMVRNALVANFHTVEPDHVLQIRDNFSELRAELNSNLTFECEDEGCDDNGYVRGRFGWIRRLGDIHVCPPWYGQDYFNRVKTLIHERAHQYPGATDNAYNWQASYATLSPEDAIDNANSYAVVARQIYHAGAHGPGT